MKELYILGNLGLGDHIICNAIVRHYADRHDVVKLPCYSHNYNTMAFMFRDNKKIQIHPIQDSEEGVQMCDGKKCLRLGCYSSDGFDKTKFDQEFYRQAGMPFSDRWDKFYVELEEREIKKGKPFAFMHEDFGRGFLIRKEMIKLETVKPLVGGQFFNNYTIMKSCDEVHCINSSFLHFWDSMPHVEGQKLFFHRYARPNGDNPSLRKKWEII